MFGPLTFRNSIQDSELNSIETKCLLCEDSFNLKVCLEIFVSHIFDVHKCVIEDVQNIKYLPEYINYWRNSFKERPIEQIIPSIKVNNNNHSNNNEQYFLFSTLLKEDQKLRHKLSLDYVINVQEFERIDKTFCRQCLFCKFQHEGTRQEYLEHLSEQHNLQLGNPQNLVFIQELVDLVDEKLRALTCIFCKGIFPERNILKEHMRKKLHKRINPDDSDYDKFFIVNYLEVGKTWKAIEKEDDRYALQRDSEENDDQEYSDWNDKEDKINCLFCDHVETDINALLRYHMNVEHSFDFAKQTEKLDYYQKIKFVNYTRKLIHNKICPYCEEKFEDNTKLLLINHMNENEHFKVPELKLFDQPEFYFPTYENDAFLYFIDDVED